MKHVMVDLETLGTVPGCVGFSVGCVEFDPITLTLLKEFYVIINVESSLEHYLREQDDTKAWWAKQSDEARVDLLRAERGDGYGLKDALEQLNSYFRSVGKKSDILLYGNGADFDNPILICMYDAAGIKPEFATYGGRCYRTLKNLHELFGPRFKAPKMQRGGTHHNALDDAKSQARHLMEFVASINSAV